MIENFQYDKSTIFSIVPFEIFEFKPGLYPGSYKIPPCYDDSKPNRLIIGPSEHLMAIGGRKDPVRNMTASFQIAESIVRDFIGAQLYVDEGSKPGICWMKDDIPVSKFLETEVYKTMKVHQKNWFVRLCKETDDEWRRNPRTRSVTDQARFAAKFLGLEPEWLLAETVGFTQTKCPACSSMNASTNAVCVNCRCILDETKFKTLKFASV